MSLSQWGLWADELEPGERAALLGSYLRRQLFESRVTAIETVRALSMALGGGRGESGSKYKEVNTQTLLDRIGVE